MLQHATFFGIGITAVLIAALVPALLSYLIDIISWWFGGKKDKSPRLSAEFGNYWCSGGLLILALGAVYVVGWALFRFVLHR